MHNGKYRTRLNKLREMLEKIELSSLHSQQLDQPRIVFVEPGQRDPMEPSALTFFVSPPVDSVVITRGTERDKFN